MNSEFDMNNEFGRTRLNEFKHIWWNLNFINPNDQILQKKIFTSNLRIRSSFFTYILLIFIFFWNFKTVNSKFDDFKIQTYTIPAIFDDFLKNGFCNPAETPYARALSHSFGHSVVVGSRSGPRRRERKRGRTRRPPEAHGAGRAAGAVHVPCV
jgi:hypothetical protein